jgi:hypothetical protein
MIGLCLVKAIYALPTWTKTVALVQRHLKLQDVLGCEGNPPSIWAAYRFTKKLRDNCKSVERCIDSVVEGLKTMLSPSGTNLALERLKRSSSLGPLRRRGFESSRLIADLTMLTKLACVLSRVRAANGADPRVGGNPRNRRADREPAPAAGCGRAAA